MGYFLQSQDGLKKIIPSVDVIKKELQENKSMVDTWFDSFMAMLAEYTPRIIAAILVLFIGLWLIKRIAILSEKAMKKKELEVSLRTFLRSLLSIGLKIVLIVTVAGMIGIGTASFVTVLGAAGLAIGLALQGSLSNFAGGVLILIFKPFKVGDSIEAGGQVGEVIEIQIFNTILLTGEHKTVILPNGPLSNGTIVNITRHGDLRIEIALTIKSDNNLDEVKRTVMQVIEKNEKIFKVPAPGVFVTKIHEGAVTLMVRPFCLPADAGELSSRLYQDLKEEFEQKQFKPALQERIIHNLSV